MAIHKATHQMLVPVWPDTKTHLYIHLHRSQLVGIFVFLPLQHAPYSQWDMTSITGTFVLKDMPNRIHSRGKIGLWFPNFSPNFCLMLYFQSDFISWQEHEHTDCVLAIQFTLHIRRIYFKPRSLSRGVLIIDSVVKLIHAGKCVWTILKVSGWS